jgi:hypothetical protein
MFKYRYIEKAWPFRYIKKILQDNSFFIWSHWNFRKFPQVSEYGHLINK